MVQGKTGHAMIEMLASTVITGLPIKREGAPHSKHFTACSLLPRQI